MGGGAGSPQTARGRGRPGRAAAGAAEGEARGSARLPCLPPASRRSPPPARGLPSLSRRRAFRCPGPSRGRAPC